MVGDCVYRLWVCKQHMCKPLAIVLKMTIWPIILISVCKRVPDDAGLYLKLGMYREGWELIPLNTFLLCSMPYVVCFPVFKVIADCLRMVSLKIIIHSLLEGRNAPFNLMAHQWDWYKGVNSIHASLRISLGDSLERKNTVENQDERPEAI